MHQSSVFARRLSWALSSSPSYPLALISRRGMRRGEAAATVRRFSAERSASGGEEGKVGPLHGVRVLELGQLIAGPWAGTVLGYFGADVVKVEPPKGDPIRGWRQLDETGTSYWWRGHARNKRSVCIDLKSTEGRDLVKKLSAESDVLIENFRPGKMEEWGLGPEDLEKINSELIYTRISGYGQTGPYSKLPGFASVCEAVGGFRYVNGFPDRPSVRPNLSMGDTMAGLQGVIGILLALQARNGNKRGGVQSSGKGQVVDVAIYESVFSLLEGVVSEYDGANVTRGCSGSTLTGIVPSNLYRGSDGKDIIIGANGDSLYSRLLDAMGVPKEDELRTWDSNAKRVENQDIIDAKIGEWVGMRSTEETLQILAKAKIPSGLIYSVEDMVTDPHYIARGQFEEVKIEELDRDLKIPAIGPRLTSTPGSTKHPGRSRPGQDSKEVLQEWLGMTDADITDLINSKAVIQND